MSNNGKLTHKQKLFCRYYLSNGNNGTQAALKAGYSKNTAYSIAHENLKKPEVRNYLESTMQERLEKIGAGIDFRAKALKACINAGLKGKANKDGCVDIDGVVKAVDVFNKMDGSYAPTNSNVTVSTSLDGVESDVEKIEEENKEVSELNKDIKEF